MPEVKEVKGKTAALGTARGKACLVINHADFKKFKPGNILVTKATNPSFTPLIAASSAVVTDLGGTLSHAAIVSREYGKPCVVATKLATRIFKDGDLVQVDADRGLVRKIK